MRDGSVRDLADMHGVRPVVLHDERFAIAADVIQCAEWIAIEGPDEAEGCWREQIAVADAAWPIAPESGGVLENLCRDVERAGIPLLNCPARAVRLAASKLATAERLHSCGVPVVPTDPLDASARPARFPVVAKPDDGAGCDGNRILSSPAEWDQFVESGPSQGWVFQPLISGEPLSLSGLFLQGEALLLSCNRQHIAREQGRFSLKGCGVNAVADDSGTFERLLAQVAAAVPELWGYAGVDLILSAHGPLVLEINPRLTTSYAGLRRSIGMNPAQLVVDLLREGRLPQLDAMTRMAVEISLEGIDGR